VTRAADTADGQGAVASVALPVFDDLDRRIIAFLRADGRASWTEIAAKVGTSVATVSRRGQRLLADSTVRVAVAPVTAYPGHGSMFFVRIACRSGATGRVVEQLSTRPNIRFMALVSGPYDIAAEVSVDSRASLVHPLITEIEETDGIEWTQTDLILHEYKVAQDWTWQLLVGESISKTNLSDPHACDESHLDEVDHSIVDVMRSRGRAPFSMVAEQVGLDETTVARRFEAMFSRGCIHVLTLAPAAALGFAPEVLLNVNVSPRRLRAVSEELSSFVGVRFVAATLSGSLLCEMIQPTNAALFSFLTETLGTIEGVRGWDASTELLTIRRGFVETPWWRSELSRHLESGAVDGAMHAGGQAVGGTSGGTRRRP
jgi:DNA-binding Lrp family transcriptional regulator